jgi:HEAT repeat protein
VHRDPLQRHHVDPAWATAPGIKEPDETDYYDLLESGFARDRWREKRLRILTWWRRNDSFRRPCKPWEPFLSEQCRQNFEALLRLIGEDSEKGLLTKAEILREMAAFEAAAQTLQKVTSAKHRSTLRQLRDLCERQDSRVRELSFEESQDVDALIELVRTNAERRWEALRALEQIGPQARAAVPILVELLSSPDTELAFQARDALRPIGGWGDRALPTLIKLLTDDRYMARGMAAKLIGEIGPKARAAVPYLQGAIADENCYVRTLAEHALQSLR